MRWAERRKRSVSNGGPITATDAQMVGNYAIKITVSGGHATGIYSWEYLRAIDPEADDQNSV